jgi:hypothetical protein
MVTSYSLEPLRGIPNQQDLLHLLRRCLFGVGYKELDFFKGKSLVQCIDVLLHPSIPETLTQHDSDIRDPLVPPGKPWFNAPYENDLINNRRGLQLKMWWVGQIITRDFSLTEKMRLFWHNHLVTEMDIVKESRYSYQYVVMLRKYALGNFQKLIREGATSAAMLVYLNGNTNAKAAPNENFARELLELFTLGKENPLNYSEGDVKAAARVLTGWRDNKETITAEFMPELHDTDDKHFSAFFNNEVIKGRKGTDGALEIDGLVSLIFSKTETAHFVCKNIYRWFVSAIVDERVEQEIIGPLALIFIKSNFEIAPVLRTLLSSKHFYDHGLKGCLVKSPVDFFLGATQQFDLIMARDHKADTSFETYLQYYFYLADMGMDVGNPPSVAGWPAYYQAPKYNEWWINSASLGFKAKLISAMSSPEGLMFNGPSLRFDFMTFAQRLPRPEDIEAFIDDSVAILLPVELNQNAKKNLMDILLSGKMNKENWTMAWKKFIENPAETVMQNRITSYFKSIITMPEFQIM